MKLEITKIEKFELLLALDNRKELLEEYRDGHLRAPYDKEQLQERLDAVKSLLKKLES